MAASLTLLGILLVQARAPRPRRNPILRNIYATLVSFMEALLSVLPLVLKRLLTPLVSYLSPPYLFVVVSS